MDVKSNEIALTAQRGVTVDPKDKRCHELVVSMTRATVRGTSQVNALFDGYVAFSTPQGSFM